MYGGGDRHGADAQRGPSGLVRIKNTSLQEEGTPPFGVRSSCWPVFSSASEGLAQTSRTLQFHFPSGLTCLIISTQNFWHVGTGFKCLGASRKARGRGAA